MYSGSLNNNTEQQEQETLLNNPLIAGLGYAGLAAGGGFVADTIRRKNSGLTYDEAARQSFGDLRTALDVLTGRSEYDLLVKNQGVQRSTKLRDYVKGDSKNKLGQIIDVDGLGPLSLKDIEKEYRKDYNKGRSRYLNVYKNDTTNPLTQMAIAARTAFEPSGEDFIQAQRALNEKRGLNAEGPRAELATKRIPAWDAIKDITDQRKIGIGNLNTTINNFDAVEREVRADKGINLLKDNLPQTLGSLAGRGANELIQNGVRGIWWLLNAPQAVSDVLAESATARANREGIYGSEWMLEEEARRRGLIDSSSKSKINPENRSDLRMEEIDPTTIGLDENTRKSRMYQKLVTEAGPDRPRKLDKDKVYLRRRTSNNYSTLLALPAAIGINAGIGLTNPFGGSDGRKAALPSEENAAVTENVLLEIANKYILGRQGDILPWEEFKKVRPDVSKDEYMRYKAYKYDKRTDLNPFDDGEINLGGILKNDNDGIFGPEVMFLGKSMPIATTLAPTLAAIGGAAVGAGIGNMGKLNLDGLDDLVEQKRFDAQQIQKIADSRKENLTKEQKDNIRRLNKQADRYETFRKYVSKVSGSQRFRKTNPIFSGIVGGFGALGASTLIGTEIERRRREDKVNQTSEQQLNSPQGSMF